MTDEEMQRAILEAREEWAEIEPDQIRRRDAALADIRWLADHWDAASETGDWTDAAETAAGMEHICDDWGDAGSLPEVVEECLRRAAGEVMT